jgi:hypothetical protein
VPGGGRRFASPVADDGGTTTKEKDMSYARRVMVLGAGLALAAVAGTGVALAGSDAPSAKSGLPAAGTTQALGSTQIVNSSNQTVQPGRTASAFVTCPVGTKVLGGGETNEDTAGNVVLTDSLASADRTWIVFVRNFGTTAQPFHANAVCGS